VGVVALAHTMTSVAPVRQMTCLRLGLLRHSRVGGTGVNRRFTGNGWVPRTSWFRLAPDEVGISGDGDLGDSTTSSSTNGAGSSFSSKCGGNDGRSMIVKD
jgi:hypothetical protein